MRKKYLALLIVFVLLISLTACGGDNKDVEEPVANEEVIESEEELVEAVEVAEAVEVEEAPEVEESPKIDIEMSGILVDGKSVEKNYVGTGPATLETRLGSMVIPEGLDYQVYQVPLEGKTTSLEIDFGVGNTNAGYINISTTKMVKSLDEAVLETIGMNDFGTMESVIGEEIAYGDKTFKEVTIKKSDGSRVDYFLTYYYPAENDWDGFVEVKTNGEGGAYKMDIKDPLITALLESLVVR
ncbi:MAG: hypothetical protein RBR71_11255 [Gudongella sp.]|nr:hypothetical protein [Gudongella sp.]